MTKQEGIDRLKNNVAMKHLIEACEDGKDIGHYGRLTLAMVARHFLEPDDLAALLAQDKDESREEAAGLVHQVNDADYSPPGPGKIRKWQQEQDFPILPEGHDNSDDANVYQDLDFPDKVYDGIKEYHRDMADS